VLPSKAISSGDKSAAPTENNRARSGDAIGAIAILAVTLLPATILFSPPIVRADETVAVAEPCGPFGDAPAEVNSGFFATLVSRHNPICIAGQVLGPWRDAGGSERYACVYEPGFARPGKPLPLLVFIHGSTSTADSVLATGLTGRIEQADLGDGPGFILLAPEGRYGQHQYPGLDGNGLGWDNWYRQFSPAGAVTVAGVSYDQNPDAAAIDHFVAAEVATGKVDSKRIFVMGWSNGAAMAILYALNRPQVAAAAVYSAPDPFGAFDDRCAQTPVANPAAGGTDIQVYNPRVPILHVRNSCDIGGICPNGELIARQVDAFGGDLQDVILDSSGAQVPQCEDACGTDPKGAGEIGFWDGVRGFAHHAMWPKPWNDTMLNFLKHRPLGEGSVR